MPLQIIGAGFGRTGTLSLKHAIEELGFGPCHHMTDIVDHDEEKEMFLDALANRDTYDWSKIFENPKLDAPWQSTVDFPTCLFYKELLAKYPKAKVILTVRDNAQVWYDSALEAIYSASNLGIKVPLKVTHPDFGTRMIWKNAPFNGQFLQRGKDIYNEWIEEVKANVPADQLLIFNVKEGWAPLCEFLGVPTPDTPFPRVNDRASIRRNVNLEREALTAEQKRLYIYTQSLNAAQRKMYIYTQKLDGEKQALTDEQKRLYIYTQKLDGEKQALTDEQKRLYIYTQKLDDEAPATLTDEQKRLYIYTQKLDDEAPALTEEQKRLYIYTQKLGDEAPAALTDEQKRLYIYTQKLEDEAPAALTDEQKRLYIYTQKLGEEAPAALTDEQKRLYIYTQKLDDEAPAALTDEQKRLYIYTQKLDDEAQALTAEQKRLYIYTQSLTPMQRRMYIYTQ